MNYKSNERDSALLFIGSGETGLKDVALYEELEKQNLIRISRVDGLINSVELTFVGSELFNRLQKLEQAKKTKIY